MSLINSRVLSPSYWLNKLRVVELNLDGKDVKVEIEKINTLEKEIEQLKKDEENEIDNGINESKFEMELNEYLQEVVNGTAPQYANIPGDKISNITVSVKRGGYIKHFAAGSSQLGTTTVDTKYSVRSAGKPLTSLLTYIMLEQGYFTGASRPSQVIVNDYLPSDIQNKVLTIEQTDGSVPSSGPGTENVNTMTLENCLNEECGIGYRPEGSNLFNKLANGTGDNIDLIATNLEDWVREFINNGYINGPYGTVSYGGGNTMAGFVCQKAYNMKNGTSLTFQDILNELLFNPCGANVEFLLKGSDVTGTIPDLLNIDGTSANYYLQGKTDAMQGGNGMVISSKDMLLVSDMITNLGMASNGNKVANPSTINNFLNYNDYDRKFEIDFNTKWGFYPQNRAFTSAAGKSDFSMQTPTPTPLTRFVNGLAKVIVPSPSSTTSLYGISNTDHSFWLGLWGTRYSIFAKEKTSIVINCAINNVVATLGVEGQIFKIFESNWTI